MKLSNYPLRMALLGPTLRHPLGVVGATVFLAVLALLFTATHLEFQSNRHDLISSGDRYRQLDERYSREFEAVPDRVAVVIEARNPEHAKAFATTLGRRWEGDPGFSAVQYRIDVDPLKAKGLWYLAPDDLTALRQKLDVHKDVVRELADSPTLENLFALINREMTTALVGHVFTGFLEEDEEKGPPDLTLVRAILRQMNGWLTGPRTYESTWETVFAGDAAAGSHDGFLWSDDRRLLFVLADPRPEAGNFNRFDKAVARIRSDVREIQRAYPDVQVGITGRAVMESDEMAVAQRDMAIATVISVLGVAVLLVVAFRGVVRPALAVLTLGIGLSWSLGFTTLTIGHLNILTIVFLPMLVGLGIDYSIHFIARFEEERGAGRSVRDALARTFAGTGKGIVAAALTTAVTFATLMLTGFKGLMELGFLGGSGILLAALAAFTTLPALLVLHEKRRGAGATAGEGWRGTARQPSRPRLYRYPRLTVAASALLVGLSVLALGGVRSDFNLLRLQAEGTEAWVWTQRISESSTRSLLFDEIAAASLEEARRKVTALETLPSVAEVDSVLSVLPRDQERKRDLIAALRPLVANVAFRWDRAGSVDLEALRTALGRIKFKMAEGETGAPGSEEEQFRQERQEVRRLIEQFAETTERMRPADARRVLSEFQVALLRDLDAKVATLTAQVNAGPVAVGDLPAELRSRYVGRTGYYRLFVYPSENVWEYPALARFVGDLRSVDPDAHGTPVTTFEYLRTMKDGYQGAAVYAVIAVGLLALLTFRAAQPALLALVPLGVGAMWTLGLMALFDVPFNTANLLFLPLIVGIGIGNGIFVVHRSREAGSGAAVPSPLANSTARAITLSSLTTLVGFGSLMISSHPGIRSLGLIVALGVTSVLVASLATLPGLLALLGARAQRAPSDVCAPSGVYCPPALAPAAGACVRPSQGRDHRLIAGHPAAMGADSTERRGA